MSETDLSFTEDGYLAALIDASPAAPPDALPGLIDRHARGLGAESALAYMADIQQKVMAPLCSPLRPSEEELGVDSTLAGRAFQTMVPVERSMPDGGTEVWAPLLDGTDRLGVLRLVFPVGAMDPDRDRQLARANRYAKLVSELLVSKSMYGDLIVQARRSRPSSLPAEIQWSLLPPLNFETTHVTLSGSLEPAYDVAGDTLDYAVNEDRVHLAVIDAMGHGLDSASVSALTISAYRHSRRQGASLTETARTVDEVVAGTRAGESFCTAILAELDPRQGVLQWVNAGHPDPLLLRDGSLVKTLGSPRWLRLGLNAVVGSPGTDPHVGREQLEPDDKVLFYTDGVVEARSPGGEFFGLERLVDLVTRHLSELSPAETMRRVVRAVLEHQNGRLDDDASMLLMEWTGG